MTSGTMSKVQAKHQRRTGMSLQANLDAFKADFEAGKPPYNNVMPNAELKASRS
jgi:hypothetical protein